MFKLKTFRTLNTLIDTQATSPAHKWHATAWLYALPHPSMDIEYLAIPSTH